MVEELTKRNTLFRLNDATDGLDRHCFAAHALVHVS